MTEEQLQGIKERVVKVVAHEGIESSIEKLECVWVVATEDAPLLIAEIERLREVLQFYAVETNYNGDVYYCENCTTHVMDVDKGAKARAALVGDSE